MRPVRNRWPRPKELLASELEALKEELGRTTQKRTFKDMTGEEFPPIEG